ncbi:MAG: hypothetical protein LH469_05240 [Frankiaceae bacterium]|nr:hypothetical protein [Frankiaceae bacterium]
MNRTRLISAALVTTAAVALTTLLGPGVAYSTPSASDGVKAATARYHSVGQAMRDGYSGENEPCVALPDGPAMGIHYVNKDLVADPAIDPRRPEILLYAPDKHNRLVLVGVEYLVADADPTTDGDRPSLFGQPFDGPMLGHAPGMPVHYDLHAWVWSDNPDGEYAAFKPALSCP